MLRGRTIVVGVSGGIAAYKACELVRSLQGRGASVVVAMSTAAAERALPIVIQIRCGGRLVFVSALPGSTASNDDWATRKARVAQHFERSSLHVRLAHELDGQDVNTQNALSPELFRAFGGAFPLRARGVGVIGTVVVSGLPQLDDHAFVIEQLKAHLKTG